MDDPRVHPAADVDESAELGPRTTVWHLAQIRENARLGADCIVGRGAYVGPGVVIGNQVKLQNYALVYEPAVLVFHLHRPDHKSLLRQYWSWGEGMMAHLAKAHAAADEDGRVKTRGLVGK